MRALTVHQPSAWAIVAGIKDVENRTRDTDYRGWVLIHAGRIYMQDMKRWMRSRGITPPPEGETPVGAIIGACRIVDTTQDYCGLWSSVGAGAEESGWHWKLADAVKMPESVRCRGQQGFWRPPDNVLDEVLDIIGPLTMKEVGNG